ncbi:Uncharacterised protein [uncultured Comamonas sp.]|nr:Uncharacterised protein [uncultured Comamonas sp.]
MPLQISSTIAPLIFAPQPAWRHVDNHLKSYNHPPLSPISIHTICASP